MVQSIERPDLFLTRQYQWSRNLGSVAIYTNKVNAQDRAHRRSQPCRAVKVRIEVVDNG